MLDIFHAAVLALGVIRAIRQRSAVGAACGSMIAYGIFVAVLNLRSALAQGDVSGGYGLGIVFMGTALAPARGRGAWPLSTWVASHPFGRLVASAGLASCVCAISWRRSSRVRPESEEARRWDALASPFLLLAVVDTIVCVAAGTMWLLAEMSP
jgi:hypothetical protein